tara:strand:- start:74 stop:808 length:735 start_codon:yes stop_codon:yes gene_type:complete
MSRRVLKGEELEDVLDAGAIAFGKWLCRFMDGNGISHPQLVALCKICSGGKALLHSSQIANLRAARLKSPGPRGFVALEYLMKGVWAYQDSLRRGAAQDSSTPRFGNLAALVERMDIMADEDGNPVTVGYLVEVFAGLRPVPIDLTINVHSESDAVKVSKNAGRLVRKLMAAHDMDPIDDSSLVANLYPGSSLQRSEFASLLMGEAAWEPEFLEENVSRLSKLVREKFEYERHPSDLLEELIKR